MRTELQRDLNEKDWPADDYDWIHHINSPTDKKIISLLSGYLNRNGQYGAASYVHSWKYTLSSSHVYAALSIILSPHYKPVPPIYRHPKKT